MDITSDLKKAKRGAIAKAISIFENDEKESRKLIKKIFKSSGKSVIIGITGPAGAGKSSLIDKTVMKLKKLIIVRAKNPVSNLDVLQVRTNAHLILTAMKKIKTSR